MINQSSFLWEVSSGSGQLFMITDNISPSRCRGNGNLDHVVERVA